MNIIPTLLTTTQAELKTQIELFQQAFHRIQIDVADGILVPNLTTQLADFIKLLEQKSLHFDQNCTYDFHLMVKNYETELLNIQKLTTFGLKVQAVLINSALNPDIEHLSQIYPDFIIGLDISPTTQINDLTRQYNLKLINCLQIMSVNPGFQGSPFLPNVLDKLQQLRDDYYNGIIMMDGGINQHTVPIILQHRTQPDFLCIGSYLTKYQTVAEIKDRCIVLEQMFGN